MIDLHQYGKMFIDNSWELKPFPHIKLLANIKIKKTMPVLEEHTNPGIEISTVRKGRYDWNVEGRLISFGKDEVIVTCPWQKHSGHENMLNVGELIFIIIEPEKFDRKKPLFLGKWCTLPLKIQNKIGKLLANNHSPVIGKIPEVNRILQECMQEVEYRKMGYITKVNNMLTELFIIIGRNLEQMEKELIPSIQSSLQILIKKIHKNPGNKWTLQTLAKSTGYGVTAFSEHFKKFTGFSPMNYILRCRIERAQYLLRSDKIPITDLAMELGFATSQHFADIFKKYTGMTPREYRKKYMIKKS